MKVFSRSSLAKGLYISLVLMTVALFLVFPTPASFAREQSSVSVQVTIGPSIRVGPGGAIKSNVATLAFEESALLTIVAR